MYEQRFNPYAANVDIVKGYFRSPKVLVLGILHLISMGLSILTLLTTPVTSSLMTILARLESLGIDTSEFYRFYPSDSFTTTVYTASVVAAIFISSVFTILTAIAFIILFAKSRSSNPDANPVAGARILHVLSVITFVYSIFVAVVLGFAFVLTFIAVYASSDYYDFDSGAATVAMVVLGVFIALMIFLIIFYAASQKNYYGSVKRSLTSVELRNKGAAAWGVLCIIAAVFYGISVIAGFISAITSYITVRTILSLSSTIFTFVILILSASVALGYSKYIKREKYSYNTAPNNTYIPAAPYMGNQGYYPDDQGYYPDSQPNYPYNQPSDRPSVPYNDNFVDYNANTQERPDTCPNCGAPIDGVSPFCSNCGTKL